MSDAFLDIQVRPEHTAAAPTHTATRHGVAYTTWWVCAADNPNRHQQARAAAAARGVSVVYTFEDWSGRQANFVALMR